MLKKLFAIYLVGGKKTIFQLPHMELKRKKQMSLDFFKTIQKVVYMVGIIHWTNGKWNFKCASFLCKTTHIEGSLDINYTSH
jgi:hypothetical protein